MCVFFRPQPLLIDLESTQESWVVKHFLLLYLYIHPSSLPIIHSSKHPMASIFPLIKCQVSTASAHFMLFICTTGRWDILHFCPAVPSLVSLFLPSHSSHNSCIQPNRKPRASHVLTLPTWLPLPLRKSR